MNAHELATAAQTVDAIRADLIDAFSVKSATVRAQLRVVARMLSHGVAYRKIPLVFEAAVRADAQRASEGNGRPLTVAEEGAIAALTVKVAERFSVAVSALTADGVPDYLSDALATDAEGKPVPMTPTALDLAALVVSISQHGLTNVADAIAMIADAKTPTAALVRLREAGSVRALVNKIKRERAALAAESGQATGPEVSADTDTDATTTPATAPTAPAPVQLDDVDALDLLAALAGRIGSAGFTPTDEITDALDYVAGIYADVLASVTV